MQKYQQTSLAKQWTDDRAWMQKGFPHNGEEGTDYKRSKNTTQAFRDVFRKTKAQLDLRITRNVKGASPAEQRKWETERQILQQGLHS